MEDPKSAENKPKKREAAVSRMEFRRMMAVSGVVIFTACVIILFYFIVDRFTGFREGWAKVIHVLQPFIIGFALAFLMNPIMMFLEKQFRKAFLPRAKTPEKERHLRRGIRTLSAILSLIILALIIGFFVRAVVPDLIQTVRYLIDHIEEQIYGVLDWANEITGGNYEESIMNAKDAEVLRSALNTAVAWAQSYFDLTEEDQLIALLVSSGMTLGRLFVDTIIGMIVAVYVLISKETFKGQIKKVIYGIFRPAQANWTVGFIRKADTIFYGFIIGKIIDSIIIGFICYFCMLIMRMPYAVLCSFIIGMTNIIPVFGPYFGAVPTVIIIFLTDPMKGIYFLIFVFILQQVDGNIIGPKILGDSTGLSSFWVVAAIVIGGGLFGVPGMVLGVPTMALIYYLCGEISVALLRRRRLPEETKAYIRLKDVDLQTNALNEKAPADGMKSGSLLFARRKQAAKEQEEEK